MSLVDGGGQISPPQNPLSHTHTHTYVLGKHAHVCFHRFVVGAEIIMDDKTPKAFDIGLLLLPWQPLSVILSMRQSCDPSCDGHVSRRQDV